MIGADKYSFTPTKGTAVRTRIPALLAAASLALPLAALTAAPAQASARHTLTVKVIDRAGHTDTTDDVMLVRIASGANIDLGTSRHRSLAAGTYNVAVWIITGSGTAATYTLADRIVSLSASKTVVLDARRGRPVRLRLDNAAAQAETLEVAPILNGTEPAVRW